MMSIYKGIKNAIPDYIFLKLQYRKYFHQKLDLRNPQTFREKLAWLKLYDRKPEYTMMMDKYLVKAYVKETLGGEYVIPLLGGPWESVDEIDFEKLPNQFVLKCTHNSHGLVICPDKGRLDVEATKKKLAADLHRNGNFFSREWPYKNGLPRIIAEQYMVNEGKKDLTDYKFYCFHSVPMYCLVVENRTTNLTKDWFDMNWRHQDCIMNEVGRTGSNRNALEAIEKPAVFEDMKRCASVLSQDIPFCRVDFYIIDNKVYFGEITFYPCGGLFTTEPDSWDMKLGNLLRLPQ